MAGGRRVAIAVLVAVHVVWGGTFVVAKLAYQDFSPLAVGALWLSLAAALSLGWAAARNQLWPPPASLRTLALLGMLGMGAYTALLYVALGQTTVMDASIIYAITPSATVALAALFLGERATGRRWLGTALSLLGVAVVVVLGGSDSASADAPNRVLGDLGLLVAAVGWAAYTVANKRLQSANPVATFGYLFAFGALVLVPLAAADVAAGGRFQPTLGGALAVLFIAWGVYALGFLGWANALKYLDAGQVGAFLNLSPIVSIVTAAVVLGETITAVHLGGGLLVLLGVWLASR
jgi:drug/metabolite transporter (DMT)-like permease